MINFEEFVQMIGSKPAEIIAKSDEEDNTTIKMNGRGIELLALSLTISEDMISKLPLTVDDYCQILKDAVNMHKTESKETMSKEDEEIKKAVSKIFDAIFSNN